jgi:hypothetical protein
MYPQRRVDPEAPVQALLLRSRGGRGLRHAHDFRTIDGVGLAVHLPQRHDRYHHVRLGDPGRQALRRL